MTDSKWAREIIGLQQPDGSWGCFHTLSKPTKARPMTTEQALRRLRALGLTKDDAPIGRALDYMRDCLAGKRRPPDGREKVLNWDAFEAHMLAAWIRLFVPEDPLALPVARMWADMVTRAFESGAVDEAAYAQAYRARIPALHQGERMIALSQFYMVNLLQGMLDAQTERRFVDYVLHCEQGIYYIYDARVADLPPVFASKQTNAYLTALEQLAGYACAGEKLGFAADWLLAYRDGDGWDLSASVKDNIYFPVSDSWRKAEDRRRDCTVRIEKLLARLRRG